MEWPPALGRKHPPSSNDGEDKPEVGRPQIVVKLPRSRSLQLAIILLLCIHDYCY